MLTAGDAACNAAGDTGGDAAVTVSTVFQTFFIK
jgi:hypothetical protein